MKDYLFKKVELKPEPTPNNYLDSHVLSPPPYLHHRQPPEQGQSSSATKLQAVRPPGSGGASTEAAGSRPRGRPRGSRNKQKPPLIITQLKEPPMRTITIHIKPGADIVAVLKRLSRDLDRGVNVLGAFGSVRGVSVRQPSDARILRDPDSDSCSVAFDGGPFDIVSLNFACVPRTVFPTVCNVSLGGPRGLVFGGPVVGELVAASDVTVVLTTIANCTYERVPELVPNLSCLTEVVVVVDHEVAASQSSDGAGAGAAGGSVSASDVGDSGAGGAMPLFNCDHLFI